jgi:hypothetical protein
VSHVLSMDADAHKVRPDETPGGHQINQPVVWALLNQRLCFEQCFLSRIHVLDTEIRMDQKRYSSFVFPVLNCGLPPKLSEKDKS